MDNDEEITDKETIIELMQYVRKLTKENKILKAQVNNSLANNLCPDHRDKQQGKGCLACAIEKLESKQVKWYPVSEKPDTAEAVLSYDKFKYIGPDYPEYLEVNDRSHWAYMPKGPDLNQCDRCDSDKEGDYPLCQDCIESDRRER